MKCDNCGAENGVRRAQLATSVIGTVSLLIETDSGPLLCTGCMDIVDEALATRPWKAASPDDEVLDAIDVQRIAAGLRPLSKGARSPAKIRARRKQGATQEELLAVVAAFGNLVAREPDKRTVLNPVTMFTGLSTQRTGGWQWGLRLVEQQRLNASRGLVPKSVREIEEERAR